MGAAKIAAGEVVNGYVFVEPFRRDSDGRFTYRWRVRCSCGAEFLANRRELLARKPGCHHPRRAGSSLPGGFASEVPDADLIELVQLGETRLAIAAFLSDKLGHPVTKNQVCGRLWRIGVSDPKPKPKPPPRAEPEPGACVFPFGDPAKDDFHYCGDPAMPGHHYCASHRAVAYLRRKAAA